MSRSLLGFLLFCVLLLAASAGVVWYVGPTAAGIVFDGERRENPYYVLQLLPAAALPDRPQGDSYRARFLALAAEDEARLAWRGGPAEVTDGPVLLDVAGVQLLEFPTGGDLVQMLTSSGYRALQDGGRELGARLLGSPRGPASLAASEASVVVLYRPAEDGPAAPLGAPGQSGWLATLPDYGGAVRWHAPVSSIRGDAAWNRVLIAQFRDAGRARAWLEDPQTVTERAIAGRHLDSAAVLLVEPSPYWLRQNTRTVPNSSNSPRFGNVSALISSIR